MFPLHTWLPDAHVEAPTGGSVILAGVLLKIGTYGFLRFAHAALPDARRQATSRSCIGARGDRHHLRRAGRDGAARHEEAGRVLVGRATSASSCSGSSPLNVTGIEGAIYQMLNHGLSTGALFLLVGMIYERRHTRQIAEFGGLWKPICRCFAALFLRRHAVVDRPARA